MRSGITTTATILMVVLILFLFCWSYYHQEQQLNIEFACYCQLGSFLIMEQRKTRFLLPLLTYEKSPLKIKVWCFAFTVRHKIITLWHSTFWKNPAKITVAHKFETNILWLHLFWRSIETLHDVKKLAKREVPYICV